jgi:hypothetical protein
MGTRPLIKLALAYKYTDYWLLPLWLHGIGSTDTMLRYYKLMLQVMEFDPATSLEEQVANAVKNKVHRVPGCSLFDVISAWNARRKIICCHKELDMIPGSCDLDPIVHINWYRINFQGARWTSNVPPGVFYEKYTHYNAPPGLKPGPVPMQVAAPMVLIDPMEAQVVATDLFRVMSTVLCDSLAGSLLRRARAIVELKQLCKQPDSGIIRTPLAIGEGPECSEPCATPGNFRDWAVNNFCSPISVINNNRTLKDIMEWTPERLAARDARDAWATTRAGRSWKAAKAAPEPVGRLSKYMTTHWAMDKVAQCALTADDPISFSDACKVVLLTGKPAACYDMRDGVRPSDAVCSAMGGYRIANDTINKMLLDLLVCPGWEECDYSHWAVQVRLRRNLSR